MCISNLEIEPSASSHDAIKKVRRAEPTARSCDAIDPVRRAETSSHNRDASNSVRSTDNSILDSHAADYIPLAINLVRSDVMSDVLHSPSATGVLRTSQNDATFIDINDSSAVNVSTPPEVIASMNAYPTPTNIPTQAVVIALLTHSGAHNNTWSGERDQAQVVDGTTSELVVMMHDISTDALLNPPDNVLEVTFVADIEICCALDDTDEVPTLL